MQAPVQLLSASLQNLGRLVLIRLLVLAAQAGSVGFAWLSGRLDLPWTELGITLGVSALLSLCTALRLRASWPVTELEYAIQLGCDLVIHSVLLYYTGGSSNPFVSYYLVPLTIAAATLPWLHTLSLAGLALASYTLLLVWSHPLEIPAGTQESLVIRSVLPGCPASSSCRGPSWASPSVFRRCSACSPPCACAPPGRSPSWSTRCSWAATW